MYSKERDEHEMACTRCGAEAEWSFRDSDKRWIEIMCPNCGRYDLLREEFDQATAEHVAEEPEA